MKIIAAVFLGCALVATSMPPPAIAAAQYSEKKQAINSGTVGIISGGSGGTDLSIVRDLATVLNDGGTLRVLPIIGQGSLQTIDDILYLKGVDVGVVQSDVLAHIKRKPGYATIGQRINYIAKLFDLEFHLVAGRHINSIKDLAGKRVNFGPESSGTHITAAAVFEALGIKVTPVHHDIALGLKMAETKEIAAAVLVSGKPDNAVLRLRQSQGLHLLPVDYARALRKSYLPALLTPKDYPDFIAAGTSIPTISVGAVMAIFNWKPKLSAIRHQKVVRFINAFIERYPELRKAPRHPKWRETNIAATVPGWTRFPAAQRKIDEKLTGHRPNAAEGSPPAKSKATPQNRTGNLATRSLTDREKAMFMEFLREKKVDASEVRRAQLFSEFSRWLDAANEKKTRQ